MKVQQSKEALPTGANFIDTHVSLGRRFDTHISLMPAN